MKAAVSFLLMFCLLFAACAEYEPATSEAGTSEGSGERSSDANATDATGADEYATAEQTPAEDTAAAEPAGDSISSPPPPPDGEAAEPNSDAAPEASASPESNQALEFTLTPENTEIQFVGLHTGDDPRPRTGNFGQFSGKLVHDSESGALTGISVEIDTESIDVGIERLTNHVKSADFLEVREYPKATFESTEITRDGETDQYTVKGNLNLHGVEKEVTFPATATFENGQANLKSEFSIDRTDYNINYDPGRVVEEVSITVTVGEPS
ncbi:MAG: YceI family protein [Pirellulales bacterium]